MATNFNLSTIPTVEDLNDMSQEDYSVFLVLLTRVLKSSDLAATYQVLNPSTIEDLCDFIRLGFKVSDTEMPTEVKEALDEMEQYVRSVREQ